MDEIELRLACLKSVCESSQNVSSDELARKLNVAFSFVYSNKNSAATEFAQWQDVECQKAEGLGVQSHQSPLLAEYLALKRAHSEFLEKLDKQASPFDALC